MKHRLYSLMFSISHKSHQQMITPNFGLKILGPFPSNSHRFFGSSAPRSYPVEPTQPPHSSGVQPDPKLFAAKEAEDEKRKLAAQLIAKGMKTMEEEDKKFRLKNAKLAKVDWKSLEQSLSLWQIRIADILQQMQDIIPQSLKNKVKGR